MTDSTTLRSFCVYKISNSINDKLYIGLTTTGINIRWSHHCTAAQSGSPTLLHRAMRKYGFDQFSIEVIEQCLDHETLLSREIYWIQHYGTLQPNGYNITAGGEGSLGVTFTEEQKQKIAVRLTGREVKSGTREKQRAGRLGKRASHETLQKLHHAFCALTDEQAAIIKFNAYGLFHKDYAAMFGVSRSAIGFIVAGKTYKHVTREHLPLDLRNVTHVRVHIPGRDEQNRFVARDRG